MVFGRWASAPLTRALAGRWVQILFGARQTGKSTLLRALLPHADLWIDLSDPGARAEYLMRPGRFVEECLAFPASRRVRRIVVDEVQTVPAVFDAVQHLYDNHPGRFRFVLSGSSARKLRRAGANLLPGRAITHQLFALTTRERPALEGTAERPLLALPGALAADRFPPAALEERLAFGELPGIALASTRDRPALLRSYATVYLEEELRREALVKDWPAFARFLELAARESGQITNYASISRQAAISLPTVKSHYQLLEDMFVGFSVPGFTGSARKHVLSTPRFYFFDLGVRHAAAGLAAGRDTVRANPGPLLEQWVAIEIHKRLSYLGKGRLSYLRTKAGAEIDFIVDYGKKVLPIEVKWTDAPSIHDARHLLSFLAEQGPRAPEGYIVCRCDRPRRIADKILAIPWWAL